MNQIPDYVTNLVDDDGKPAGGFVLGPGIAIAWQRGPLGRGDERLAPNGTFVETVIGSARQRLAWYQDTQFACDENAKAIAYLDAALGELNARTQRREAAGVEGTHAGR